jgi:formylglycine-generating enzyme required for sulfatase activity
MRPPIQCLLAASTLSLAALVLLVSEQSRADKDNKEKAKYPIVEKMTHKGYTEKIPDTKVSFEMVPIPAGTFMMGSPKTEKGRADDEGPQHPVQLKGFWMGKCEVTWDEFDAWWRGRPGKKEDKEPEKPKDADAVTRPTPPYADETFGLGREGNPVICLSHHCVMQYCRWLSIKTGKVYRLPTEAEWEWACRAGTTTVYSFGDDPKDLGDYAWFADNSNDKPQPVGKKKANPWGLHDMHGNVAEWVVDHYKKDYYGTFKLDKPTLQPVLKPTADRFSHPVRGGSWVAEAEKCRSAVREASNIDWLKLDPQGPKSIWWLTSAEHVGFRVVCAIEEQDNLKGLRSLTTRQSK